MSNFLKEMFNLLSPGRMQQPEQPARVWTDSPGPANAWTGGPAYVLSDKGEDILRHAPTPDPVLGYANLPMYEVSGKRKTTGRKNTRRIRALNVEQVRDYALNTEGLMEPLQISLVTTPDPYFGNSEYGLTIPVGASRWDAQTFENCVIAWDTKHIPPAFMSYLTAKGIPMTWLAGRNAAAQALLEYCDARERAILYGYAVHCSLCGVIPKDVECAMDSELYHAFADAAARDAAAYTSMVKRPGSDMWTPSKNTKAYQFAVSFFSR